MKRARLGNTKNFYFLNKIQKKFQKLDNNLTRYDKKTREYDFSFKFIKLVATKVSRVVVTLVRVLNVVVNTYKNKISNFNKFKSFNDRKKNINLVTRSIIEEDRCLIYKKFDYKLKYCFDKEKENFIYLE